MANERHDLQESHDVSENPRIDQSVNIDLSSSTEELFTPLQETPLRREKESHTFNVAKIFFLLLGALLLCGLLPVGERFLKHVKGIMDIFSPFLGVILGYYFGTRHEGADSPAGVRKHKKQQTKGKRRK